MTRGFKGCFEASITGRDIAIFVQHFYPCFASCPQTKANALMVTGHTDDDEDDFESGPVDHPDEEGGSKLCEIGGNEQWEGQLIFLNSI